MRRRRHVKPDCSRVCEKVERFFQVENLADPDNLGNPALVSILSLRAHALMHRDKDYVVKDDEVLIVDEFTGRIMPGRRYSDGSTSGDRGKRACKSKKRKQDAGNYYIPELL